MFKKKIFIVGFLVSLLQAVLPTYAEDIDLYSGLSGSAGTPNLMFVIDSSANSSGNFPACTYYDGTSPSLGSTTLGNEQCALVNIMHTLPTNTNGNALIQLGIVSADGIYFPLTPIDDKAYTAPATSYAGTFTVPSGLTNRQAFIAAVKALTKHTGAVVQGPQMQETWAYYTGGNGGSTGTGLLSGNNFSGTNAKTGCQKNFSLYLGGVDSNAHADIGNSAPVANAPVQLSAAVDNAYASHQITQAQQTLYKTTITTGAKPDKYAGNGVAREWSQFMVSYDINTDSTGTQSITTYSLSILGGTNVDMTNFIKDIGNFGRGKAFSASSYDDIVQSILKVLNEVQAVNSVFASSSLPVSVNTQGTFLNQVFIGMFRPDALGNPRWLGNLKQYQFLLDSTTGIVSLGDSVKHCANSQGQSNTAFCSAISSAGTGFISPNAISYWTCGSNTSSRPCAPVADPTGGFWVNQPQSAGGAFDLPDGELVEKGGAAQILRLANLSDDYTTAAGTSTNPRKLYTYCPSNSASCSPNLTNAANAFSTANTDIAAAQFVATPIKVVSITRSGTTATVKTQGNNGYSASSLVTITGANQPEYNVNSSAIAIPNSVSCPAATCFTFTVPDYPTTPTQGTYKVSLHNSLGKSITSISRPGSTSGATNTETALVTTTTAHGYSAGDHVTITGASGYNVQDVPIAIPNSAACPAATCFSISVPVTPSASQANSTTVAATNVYTVSYHIPPSYTVASNTAAGVLTLSSTPTNLHVGQQVGFCGSTGNKWPACPSYYSTTISAISGNNVSLSGTPSGAKSGTGGTLTVTSSYTTTSSSTTAGITRTSNAASTLATVTGAPANYFANNDVVDITKTSGTNGSETEFASTSATISCSGTCATFTYNIATSPSPLTVNTTTNPSMSVSISSGTQASISAGNITRPDPANPTTVTVSGITANTFSNGQFVDIAATGTVYSNESPYTQAPSTGWQITCSGTCTSFTFGPVTLTPASPATGTITAYSASTPPDTTSLINWVRGQDNVGDETASPGGTITVRPSIHGDVLHSRPVVINYGGTTGVVAFYGSNDGVFHAVNGNQSNPSGSTLPIPGSELWGFIPKEFYSKLSRLRTNSPQLKLPSTPSGILPAPQPKDYFADGSTGVYQEVNASGTTTTADIFISMRRGGSFIYALDVLNPTSPQFKWKIDTSSTGFSELGQTWSRPKTAKVAGYANTVLIFGAGYDTAEDSEPSGTDTSGRGIYIVDADTGALIWSATYGTTSACSGTTTQATCTVAGMNYSIPSDVTLVDIDSDGKIDRLYVGDTGGNVWRVDLEPTAGNTPDKWHVTKLAELGCSSGVCSSGTPRKFFYPPDVVPASGYDAIMIGSGDREHPLLSNAAASIANRIYALSDFNTGKDGSSLTTPITEAKLFNASNGSYNGKLNDNTTVASGFYIPLASGEKIVNAPATVAGQTFFGTNQPTTPSPNSCDTQLGIARGYVISPFTGNGQFSIFNGGGLPPSPVYGVVEITKNDASGNETTVKVPFCIGCGGTGSTSAIDNGGYTGGCATDSTLCADITGGGGGGGGGGKCGNISSLEACKAIINASTDRHRNYWYIERDQ